jgi:hypothetical protein
LEAQVKVESERVSIAVRFVEWFTSRGQHYEHNMKIIDKHLKGLIVSGSGSAAKVGADEDIDVGNSSGGGSSSHVHSYFLPGNKVVFQPQPDHAR